MPISVRLPARVEQQLAEYSERARLTKSRAVKRALERLFEQDPRPVGGPAAAGRPAGTGRAGAMKAPSAITVGQARTQLAQLIDEVAKGREVLIAMRGKPVARLVPVEAERARKPGYLKGRIRIAPDFDAPLPPHVIDSFEGGR